MDLAAALRLGVGVVGDGAHVVQARAGAPRQDEGDGHRHLGGDGQRRAGDEVVEGGVELANIRL